MPGGLAAHRAVAFPLCKMTATDVVVTIGCALKFLAPCPVLSPTPHALTQLAITWSPSIYGCFAPGASRQIHHVISF